MKRKEFYILAVLVIVSGFIGGIVSGRITGGTALAQGNQKTLDLETLRIVDAAGRPRIALSTKTNNPTMAFFDESGEVRIGLTLVNGSDPGLLMMNEMGVPRIKMGVMADGTASMGVESGRGLGASLNSNDIITGLSIERKDTLAKCILAINNGIPGLVILGDKGKAQAVINIVRDKKSGIEPSPVIQLKNPSGEVFWMVYE